MSSKGHLSNKEALNAVSQIFSKGLKKLFFGHISEENNSYDLIEKYVDFCKNNFAIEAGYFKQMTPVKGLELDA
jgi:phosphoribosyl 1,2-cyclic phosphodiesterase